MVVSIYSSILQFLETGKLILSREMTQIVRKWFSSQIREQKINLGNSKIISTSTMYLMNVFLYFLIKFENMSACPLSTKRRIIGLQTYNER